MEEDGLNPNNDKMILLRGMAGSGKDSIATRLSSKLGIDILTLAEPLHSLAIDMLGIEYDTWWDWYDKDKEAPRDELDGLSCRETITCIAEDMVKPYYGEGHFASLLLKSWSKDKWKTNISVVTDLGFLGEFIELVNEVDADNLIVFDVERDVVLNKKDIRDLSFDPEAFGVKYVKLDNNRDLSITTDKLLDTLVDIGWLSNE